MQKTVLVTGATGLLGSELVDQLLGEEPDTRVVCLVRDFLPHSRFFTEGLNQRVYVVTGDVRDAKTVLRTINEYDVGTVYHLAAQTLVETAVSSPEETLDVNIRGTWNVLEAARQLRDKVKCVVIASSDKAYGSLAEASYDETHPLCGKHPYDVSKSCADLIAQSYAHTYGLNVVVTRCGNLFGPGDLNDSRLIPSTIRSLLANEAPLIRSDGKFIRDYIYVADAAAAYRMLAAHSLAKKCAGEAFNFSYGLRLTVLDVVEKLTKMLGLQIVPVIQNRIQNEIKVQTLDSTKAKKLLNWSPRVGLDEGLERTIRWYRNHNRPAAMKAAA